MPKLTPDQMQQIFRPEKPPPEPQELQNNSTSETTTADTVRMTTSDLIFGDLYSDKLRMQKEIMNLRALLNTKVELIITDCTHHSIFIFKEEIETLLKSKLEKAQKKFEYANIKIMQIELNQEKSK